MKIQLLVGVCALVALGFFSSLTDAASRVSEPTNGPKHSDARWHALTGATVVARPGEVVANATLVIRDGVIRSVTSGGRAPAGARVWDYSGLTVYAGFIEPYAEVDAGEVVGSSPASHWRSNVTPQRSALDGGGLDEKGREGLRELGFASAALAAGSGIFRGTGELVSLAEPETEISAGAPRLIRSGVYQSVAPETGGWGGTPPTSLMGAIAVMRQTLSDAGWYAEVKGVEAARSEGLERAERNAALEALGENNADATMLLFDADDPLDALRMARVAGEFDRRAALLGSGREFERVDAVAGLGLQMIVPVNYPKKPDVSTTALAESVSLKTLMAWEQAPTNLRRLDEAGVSVSLTTHRLKKTKDFWENVRAAVRHGLGAERALAMLTTRPANLLGAQELLGAAEEGKLAYLTVFEGDPFTDEDATLRDVWSAGERYEINAAEDTRFDGDWDVRAGAVYSGVLSVDGKKVTLEKGDETVKAGSVDINEDRVSFVAGGTAFGDVGAYRMSAVLAGDTLRGEGVDPNGDRFAWSASRAQGDDGGDDDDADEEGEFELPPDRLPVPFGAYGRYELPRAETLLISGATLWTSGPSGVIEDGALIVRDGKIVYAGVGSRVPRIGVDRTIDARGKHITPGLIDAHSHSGISGGVNEGGQAVTAEVRIADVINPDDIAWYRELAGGLTAANQLHGSANPIGGQNSVVKLRWGASDPGAFRVDGAIEGIKFALGENVKRSSGRYPDTRMGVESIIRDRFVAAREYERAHEEYVGLNRRQQGRAVPPRKDLELDALVEILNGERLIHCHSYRQDEILMLCRVAEEFGFTIGTFQHVLEGYKVAEAIAEHAIGGSCFSDWWAYKFEVYDAIPFNGALMREAGVLVSFNSDSNELARRMNTEASKAVRYGGVEPGEALKFVTINPAKQLKIDEWVGSLEAGKDADFVIWSGDPLSSLTRCEATYVDGIERFSLELDARLRERDEAERRRIVQKILREGLDGDEPGDDGEDEDGGDATLAERRLEAIGFEMLRAGLDPNEPTCGECGFMDRVGAHAHEGASR